MKRTIFKGAGCAIVTPFKADGSIDFDSFGRLIEFQIQGGTDCIVVMGTTGEASTLCDEDHLAAIRFCVDTVAGRIPVVAGAGSNDTAHAIQLSKEAEALGADGLLHVTPYYNKTSQAGLVKHFTAIADATSLPIILYSVPSRTGLKIEPETYQELAKHPNIVAAKEATEDIKIAARTAALCGDQLNLYSGCDHMVVPMMSLGGIGVISVIANLVPDRVHEMCRLYLDGKVQESAKLQLDLLALDAAMFCDVNPIPVKEALNQMGMNAGIVKLPLCETSEANKGRIHKTLEHYGLL